MHLQTFATLPSTNQYCELLDLSQTEEFTVIRALQQTAGIGQRGNHWESEAGKNLTFSLILKPDSLQHLHGIFPCFFLVGFFQLQRSKGHVAHYIQIIEKVEMLEYHPHIFPDLVYIDLL